MRRDFFNHFNSFDNDAFMFVSPEEESNVRGIERAIGQRLPRLTLAGFDYAARRSTGAVETVRRREGARRTGRARGRQPRASGFEKRSSVEVSS